MQLYIIQYLALTIWFKFYLDIHMYEKILIVHTIKNINEKKGFLGMYNKDEDDFDFRDEEIGEDATEYGEFIPSYFAWISPEKQKERAKKLQNMTKNEIKNGK